MERRVMSLGRSSLVISLPKNWMQLNELKKGDVVSFAIQRDRSLVIYPGAKKKTEAKETTLRIDTNEDELLITMKIVGCYLNGYSGITLISEKVFSVPQMKAIRKAAGMLYLRIMESNSKGVFIQTLMDETKADLKQTVLRLHMISQSMGEDAIKSLKNKDIALAKAVFSSTMMCTISSISFLECFAMLFKAPFWQMSLGSTRWNVWIIRPWFT